MPIKSNVVQRNEVVEQGAWRYLRREWENYRGKPKKVDIWDERATIDIGLAVRLNAAAPESKQPRKTMVRLD